MLKRSCFSRTPSEDNRFRCNTPNRVEPLSKFSYIHWLLFILLFLVARSRPRASRVNPGAVLAKWRESWHAPWEIDAEFHALSVVPHYVSNFSYVQLFSPFFVDFLSRCRCLHKGLGFVRRAKWNKSEIKNASRLFAAVECSHSAETFMWLFMLLLRALLLCMRFLNWIASMILV